MASLLELELCEEKQYENKQKQREKRNEKFECPCGGRYTYTNRTMHRITKIHQKYLWHEREKEREKQN
jgi:hypothetical protein